MSFSLSDANSDPLIELTAALGIPINGLIEIIANFFVYKKRISNTDTVQRQIRLIESWLGWNNEHQIM